MGGLREREGTVEERGNRCRDRESEGEGERERDEKRKSKTLFGKWGFKKWTSCSDEKKVLKKHKRLSF